MKEFQINGSLPIIAQAIAEMELLHGEYSSIDEINLAELGRRTGLSRSKLRRLKGNNFCERPHGLTGQKKEHVLDGYWNTFEDVKRDIDDWFDYYNNDRYQWQLAKLSPHQYYQYVTTGEYPLSIVSPKKEKPRGAAP